MDEREHRIRERAHRLWEEEGRPDGRSEHHWFAAKEMIAIEDSQQTALHAVDAPEPDAEPIEALVNTGEFPTLTDQGEQQAPHFPGTEAGGDIPAPHVETSSPRAAKAAKPATKAAAKPAVKPVAKPAAAPAKATQTPVKAASTPAPKAEAKPAAKPAAAPPKTAPAPAKAAPAASAAKKTGPKKAAPKKAPA
ncbi:DUF2934 domain-containing protein [Ancylobacter sp. SL191]|uniref:DUF2934 domain-containing protein n=1 Tax=Ancylobacter sp. SL191 TaxID=2995166 RepID=UPI00226F7E0D|nr:DUF2934 domain-containing protein [Ancylobacter sp. SL191]WAC27176.1 DUF2934 domain-containing protein [Ancylobacter sp. SL191]